MKSKPVFLDLLQGAKTIVVVLALAVGVSYVSAQTSDPPAGNTPAPVNVSANEQTKAGRFNVSTVFTAGDILGNVVSSNQFCIGTSCITSWPGGTTAPAGSNAGLVDVNYAAKTAYSSNGNKKVFSVPNTPANAHAAIMNVSINCGDAWIDFYNASDVFYGRMGTRAGGSANVTTQGQGTIVMPLAGGKFKYQGGGQSCSNVSFVKVGHIYGATDTTAPAFPQCNDGVDNDGNNIIDWPQDTGCASLTDTAEAGAPTGSPAYETCPPPGGGVCP